MEKDRRKGWGTVHWGKPGVDGEPTYTRERDYAIPGDDMSPEQRRKLGEISRASAWCCVPFLYDTEVFDPDRE